MMTRYEKWEGLFTMFTMESLLGHILWDFIQTCWGSNMAGFNKGNFDRENDPQRSNLGISAVFFWINPSGKNWNCDDHQWTQKFNGERNSSLKSIFHYLLVI
jgi:hypothetical protein